MTVELRGTKAIVQIGDYKAEVEDPSLAGPKVVVGLGFSFGTICAKGFQPHADCRQITPLSILSAAWRARLLFRRPANGGLDVVVQIAVGFRCGL